jgi:hypothetical protein
VGLSAIVTAGDLRASRSVYGESKVYLQVEGEPLVVHVVRSLQLVPEIEDVWLVGDEARLDAAFAHERIRKDLTKPLRIVPQFRNLYENAWETYRRSLPGAPPEGRDPEGEDLDRKALFLSADLPFATPEEISHFIRLGLAAGCDYALGLVPERALLPFQPADGKPGLDLSCFNLREGRLRQSNLHLAAPGRFGNRHYIESMYEHRHQREWGDMLGLLWQLLSSRQGGLVVAFFFFLMHLAGLADRWHLRTLANWLRRGVSLGRTERALSQLLDTRFRFVTTQLGGCAIDVDTEHEYDVVCARFGEWRAQQAALAAKIHPSLSSTLASGDRSNGAPVDGDVLPEQGEGEVR